MPHNPETAAPPTHARRDCLAEQRQRHPPHRRASKHGRPRAPPPAAAEDEERAPLHQTAAASLPSPDPAREGTVVRQQPRPCKGRGSCATSHRVQAGRGTAQAGESLRRRLARHDLVPAPLSVYVTFLANTDNGRCQRRDLRCRRRPESRPKSKASREEIAQLPKGTIDTATHGLAGLAVREP
jgi:hypothetical protein